MFVKEIDMKGMKKTFRSLDEHAGYQLGYNTEN